MRQLQPDDIPKEDGWYILQGLVDIGVFQNKPVRLGYKIEDYRVVSVYGRYTSEVTVSQFITSVKEYASKYSNDPMYDNGGSWLQTELGEVPTVHQYVLNKLLLEDNTIPEKRAQLNQEWTDHQQKLHQEWLIEMEKKYDSIYELDFE